MSLLRLLPPPLRGVLTGSLAFAAFASCEGSNQWAGLPTDPGNGGEDRSRPGAQILHPDSTMVVAVGDSVLVRVRVADNLALDSVQLSGVAVRGDLALGTQTRVQRFATKTVAFGTGAAVRDTTLARHLLFTGDTVVDARVFLVVRARDRAGNETRDSVRIALAGPPRVRVTAPRADTAIAAGGRLAVRFQADNAATRISAVRVRLAGAVTDSVVRAPGLTSSLTDSAVFTLPARATGAIRAVVSLVDASGAVRAVDSVAVRVSDQSAPALEFVQPAEGAASLAGDSVLVEVRVSDPQGLASLDLSGYAMRGDPSLGTRTRVARFLLKSVNLTGQDSATVRRYLLPAADSVASDSVFIEAVARDAAGNLSTSTRRIRVAARPRVALLSTDSVAAAGTPLVVRYRVDNATSGGTAVQLSLTGALQATRTRERAAGAAASDTLVVPVPATASGAARALLSLLVDGREVSRDSVSFRVRDRTAPTAQFLQPAAGTTVALGDSVLAEVSARDAQGLRSIDLTGYTLVGDSALGTLRRVSRFQTKTVTLAGQDSITVRRYLLAAPDSLPADTVFLEAVVRDTSGNVASVRRAVAIGGPRVQIVAPSDRSAAVAGSRLAATVVAVDRRDRIRRVVLRVLRGGASVDSLVQEYAAAEDSVSAAFSYSIPATLTGDVQLQAEALSRSNVRALSPVVLVQVSPAAADATAPSVRFAVSALRRAEIRDSVVVSVRATDNVQVSSVGVSIRPLASRGGSITSLPTVTRRASADSASFAFSLADLGLSAPSDTSTISLEVTAHARDSSGNCGAATVPNSSLSEACRVVGDTTFAATPGARTDLLLVRGSTARPAAATDRLADLVSDGTRVFASNYSRGRVDVLPIGATQFSGSVAVGAQPWGLAIGTTGDTLLVANSGGTNISVVPLASSSLAEARRITTSDIRLYGVEYNVRTDSVTALSQEDYSDRPQFIGQVTGGQILYSTHPTVTRQPGTVRILDPGKDQSNEFNRGSEIFTGYAGAREGRGIVVNALSVTRGLGLLTVCPRRLRTDQSDPACVQGTANQVSSQLAALREQRLTDTRLDLGVDVASIALRDTTFVAVSGDRSTVAFGEGAVNPGRVFLFRSAGGVLTGSSRETTDLVGNAAERVIGLGLNGDGSLGIARGQQVYLFDRSLRLQGSLASGAPSGGGALDPSNTSYPQANGRRRGFVSGVDAAGVPFIDIIDSYTFQQIRRILLRDPVIGTLVAVPVRNTEADAGRTALRLFAITRGGVVHLDLTETDLQ